MFTAVYCISTGIFRFKFVIDENVLSCVYVSSALLDYLPGERHSAVFCSCQGISGRWIWREVCWGMVAAVSSVTENTKKEINTETKLWFHSIGRYTAKKQIGILNSLFWSRWLNKYTENLRKILNFWQVDERQARQDTSLQYCSYTGLNLCQILLKLNVEPPTLGLKSI